MKGITNKRVHGDNEENDEHARNYLSTQLLNIKNITSSLLG